MCSGGVSMVGGFLMMPCIVVLCRFLVMPCGVRVMFWRLPVMFRSFLRHELFSFVELCDLPHTRRLHPAVFSVSGGQNKTATLDALDVNLSYWVSSISIL
jgi:hypothetical protein